MVRLLNGSGTEWQRTWEWLRLLHLPRPSLIRLSGLLGPCAQWQSLGEGSIALAEEDEAESQLCKLDMYMCVSKAQGGTCHGWWGSWQVALWYCSLSPWKACGNWEIPDDWKETNGTPVLPQEGPGGESEELKASQPEGSWIKFSGSHFWAWEGDCEQPAWIYEGKCMPSQTSYFLCWDDGLHWWGRVCLSWL